MDPGKCLFVRELFGRQEEELGRALGELVERFRPLGSGQGRVDQGGPAGIRPGYRLDLVALEGDERGDYDRSPGMSEPAI